MVSRCATVDLENRYNPNVVGESGAGCRCDAILGWSRLRDQFSKDLHIFQWNGQPLIEWQHHAHCHSQFKTAVWKHTATAGGHTNQPISEMKRFPWELADCQNRMRGFKCSRWVRERVRWDWVRMRRKLKDAGLKRLEGGWDRGAGSHQTSWTGSLPL